MILRHGVKLENTKKNIKKTSQINRKYHKLTKQMHTNEYK